MNLRYGVKYVLLAGDDLDVPVRGCYAYGVNKDSSIPSDLYYGCFGKEFYWDKDGDKVYGEIEDNIDFYPSVYVSRAPIRSVDDAEVFINRTIEYETNPVWNDNILMAGLHLSPAGGADAEIQGNLMYNKAIRPYWDGQLVRMYDTYSDVPSTSYYFTRYMLKTQLAKGYNFASILTHGGPYSWSCDRWEEYDLNYANSQTNSGHTVVTTMSCSTNAFDSYYEDAKDPCLSESLIRNPNSGIIAYFGASRDGFYSTNKQELGSSLSYEAELYKALFSKELKDKNWARVAALAKAKKIGESERQGQYRWLQFALNPIGDAEMPIYTAKPSDFSSANLIEDCSGITIDTQVDSCRICVMSIDDQGASFYKVYNNVQTVNLTSYPDAISICVTKQNYRPLVYEYVSNKNVLPMKRLMNNEELVYDVQYEQTSRIDRIENSNTELVVFTEHANLLQSGEIEVSNLYGAVYFKEEAHHSDVNRVSIDRWNSGIYIVSMKDCGKVVDTKRFVKY